MSVYIIRKSIIDERFTPLDLHEREKIKSVERRKGNRGRGLKEIVR